MSVKKKIKNYKSFPLSNQMSLHKKKYDYYFWSKWEVAEESKLKKRYLHHSHDMILQKIHCSHRISQVDIVQVVPLFQIQVSIKRYFL